MPKVKLTPNNVILVSDLIEMCNTIITYKNTTIFTAYEIQDIKKLRSMLQIKFHIITYEQMQFIVKLYNRLIPEEVKYVY